MNKHFHHISPSRNNYPLPTDVTQLAIDVYYSDIFICIVTFLNLFDAHTLPYLLWEVLKYPSPFDDDDGCPCGIAGESCILCALNHLLHSPLKLTE